MGKTKTTFDPTIARATIERGRRAKWWRRAGGKAKGFRYLDAQGKDITDSVAIERIASLVIPPAWRFVRIAPSASSKIQAVGMDTSGRVQYIYHSKFAEKRQREKFAKLVSFGEHLTQLREKTNADIAREGLPREKVLAVMLRLINSLYFRVGSEKSARIFKTYGITTLKNDHLTLGRSGTLTFDFMGKSYVRHKKIFVDKDLASIMKDLKAIGPKRKLFCYIDDAGKVKAIKPVDINAYIKQATRSEFSAKDFRTWGATLLAAVRFAEIGPLTDEAVAAKNVVKVVKAVAEEIGNTPTVCRSSYIHPTVISAYENGITIEEFQPRRGHRKIKKMSQFALEEASLLKLLRSADKKVL